MKIRTLISAMPITPITVRAEPMIELCMQHPDGMPATYYARSADIPRILECGAVYKVRIDRRQVITKMRMIES